MYLLLLWIAKFLQKASRLRGNSGAALPGLFIEKFSKDFLVKALKRLPEGVIVVSGTNGKTTTTKLIADALKHLGDSVLTNSTGSNMTRGLISTVVSKSTIFGKLPYNIAVLEVDEAYAAVLSRQVPINGAVVLNVMRDQLDRFGEIDLTAQMLNKLTSKANDFVVLNSSDARVSKLETRASAKTLYFAPVEGLTHLLRNEDDWHGKTKQAASAPPADVKLVESDGGTLSINLRGHVSSLETAFEGIHNHLNITAAYAALTAIKPQESADNFIKALARAQPAFGRGERIKLPHGSATLLLIKNPSSFVQTLAAADLKKYDVVTVVINDAYADSRDVSWLWDVDLGELAAAKHIMCGGSRGYDMAVRLKHEEILVKKVLLEEAAVVNEIEAMAGNHAIFCTYTAMLALRKILVKKGHVEQVT